MSRLRRNISRWGRGDSVLCPAGRRRCHHSMNHLLLLCASHCYIIMSGLKLLPDILLASGPSGSVNERSKMSNVTNDPLISLEENIQLRDQHIAESCELHFNNNPMKIISSKDQYLFDEMGNKYLDFVSRITNVGHCNSAVVEAACEQMSQLSMAVGSEISKVQHKLTKLLLSTLPPSFDVVLYTNSGAEANDLALQMVRNYTNRIDIVVVDGSFHGTGNLLVDISPRAFRVSSAGKKPWVHVLSVPDTFRGLYSGDPDAGEKYFQDAKKVIDRAILNNREGLQLSLMLEKLKFYGIDGFALKWLEHGSPQGWGWVDL
ncbi:hypothetical protein J6590_002566 [Homalodisca vitripennis]|nr:hypothetical protein J6590_002566 [Homalodisca vitripennis]